MKKATLLLALCVLGSCQGALVDRHITGKYYLIAPDVLEDVALTFQTSESSYSGLIEPAVFAVGYNERYIIAKQHPEFPSKSLTNYFIVPVKTSEPAKSEIIGPLTVSQFKAKCNELGLQKVQFSIVYKELE